ncbi:hypothetical protein MBLNU457_2189t1 [Dothideomycetes sp. NU457]
MSEPTKGEAMHTERVDDADSQDAHPKVALSTMLAVFFLGLSYVPAIATGFVMPSQVIAQIGMSLDGLEDIAWIPGGWAIGSAVSFAVAGALSDIFGRRWVVMFGQALVLIGAIVASTAKAVAIVGAGSTLIGFGAGCILVSYAGIAELLPNKYRGIGLAWTEFCITIPWGVGSGFFATQLYLRATWRWCYYISIIYAVVVLAGTYFSYYPPSHPQGDYERSRWQEFKQLDFIGLGLFTAGLVVFLVGITYLGRSTYSVPMVASTITVGGIVFASAFIYDFTLAKRPIFPLHLFRMFREFSVFLIILFVCGMIWQAMIALASQGSLYMFTNNLTEIGIISIPGNISGVIGGWILPSLVHKIKHVKWQVITAIIIQTAFTASYAGVVPNNKIGYMILPMFGQSAFTWMTILSLVSSGLFVPPEELGTVAGLLGTFRSAGGSVGNAVFATILASSVNQHLATNIAGAAISHGFDPANLGKLIPAVIENAVGVPFVLKSVPGITAAVEEATALAFKNTYAEAFKLVYYCTIPFGIVALVAAFFVRDPSHLMNNHVAVHQEKMVLEDRKQKEIGEDDTKMPA